MSFCSPEPFCDRSKTLVSGSCALGGERADGRTLYGAQRRIEFRDARNRIVEIVDFDAEMIEPAGAPIAARNDVHADVAVAEHDRARGPGLARRPHAEQRLVEPAVQRVVVAADRDVVDPGGHEALSWHSTMAR